MSAMTDTGSQLTNTYFRDHFLLIEYRALEKYCTTKLSGVYVVPSRASLGLWDGVIFVREGNYSGGVYRFRMRFPDEYPKAAPEVQFTTRLYHPQVDLERGTLNVKRFLAAAGRADGSAVLSILMGMREMFYHIMLDDALNRDAVQLFRRDPSAFYAAVRENAAAAAGEADAESRFTSRSEHSGMLQFHRGRLPDDLDLPSLLDDAMRATGNDVRKAVALVCERLYPSTAADGSGQA